MEETQRSVYGTTSALDCQAPFFYVKEKYMSINLSHCYFGFLSLQANLVLTERAQFYYPSFPPRSYSASHLTFPRVPGRTQETNQWESRRKHLGILIVLLWYSMVGRREHRWGGSLRESKRWRKEKSYINQIIQLTNLKCFKNSEERMSMCWRKWLISFGDEVWGGH